jgi:hypothetical protein
VSVRHECPRYFKIETQPHEFEEEDAQDSIMFVTGLLVTQLLFSKHPHNIIFTDNCQKAFIYPRSLKSPELGWLDLCGWSRFPEADMRKTHWQDTSLALPHFQELASNLKQAIESEFS